jgi:hypothetical protein
VIEKLEYVTPEIVGAGPYLMVEGITDYYALSIARKISGKVYSFNILPGAGSGACGPIISQLLGQGQSFAILLDDDAEGRKAAAKYADEWFIDNDRLSTLKDIDQLFSGMAMEKLLGQETMDLMQSYLKLDARPSKRQIGWYLAEACGLTTNLADKLPESAVDRLIKVLDHYETKFSTLKL